MDGLPTFKLQISDVQEGFAVEIVESGVSAAQILACTPIYHTAVELFNRYARRIDHNWFKVCGQSQIRNQFYIEYQPINEVHFTL